jgi:hypothetical protein
VALTPRSSAPRFHLTLDGAACGFLTSCEGGTMTAEVLSEPAEGESFLKKHLARPYADPLVFSFGVGMGKELYDWIAAAWAGKAAARSGEIAFADASLQARSILEFEEALVTAVTVPALDGASKEPASLTVTVQPAATRRRKASGKLPASPAAKAKQWLASNFRLEIEGLDCKRVSRVDAFTVRLAEGPTDFPGLRITLAEQGSASWRDWHETFVVQGLNDDAHERGGALVLLDPALKELGRVELQGLGIVRLENERGAAADAVARLVAEVYCERMALAL